MKNVTITVDDAALEWVRIEAARRNTSVSRLVGEMIAEKMARTDAYARATRDWMSKDRLWSSNGASYPSRSTSAKAKP
ncbi:CopG family transcriptional regulator [Curvibacter sp. CHRR-16]|uniref:CopG family transcriptional regulator n=1 Tax=Curvibacter sp. CHRR-16 TaxID=2835872 RepID=UPI001BDB1468|nr:CopG family transcriptional regulator [Curvibacter sp. CHRR-16]MBT0569426.1 CopG family transcriptional regulator [Curvibacter sp. CHRR-16]